MNTRLWFLGTCPNCAGSVQQHSSSAWCMRCGWARNRYADPATVVPPARWGMLGNARTVEGSPS